jgi:hypothetical protein
MKRKNNKNTSGETPKNSETTPAVTKVASENQNPIGKDQASESNSETTNTPPEVNPEPQAEPTADPAKAEPTGQYLVVAKQDEKLKGDSTTPPVAVEPDDNATTLTVSGPVEMMPLDKLEPHPLHTKLYGNVCPPELIESIRKYGILQPLLITRSTPHMIIAGNSRAEGSRTLKIDEVPVTYFGSDNALEIEAAVVDSNKQRVKTPEQKGREFIELKRIEEGLANLRMGKKDRDGQPVKKFTPEEVGKSRDRAAAKCDVSGPTGEKMAKVIGAIDALLENGNEDDAETVRALLNGKSVQAAYKKGRDLGKIHVKPRKGNKPKPWPNKGDKNAGGLKPGVGVSTRGYEDALQAAYTLEDFISKTTTKVLGDEERDNMKPPMMKIAAWAKKL